MMGRRRTSTLVGYRNSDDRASIGDVHVEQAITEISAAAQASVALQTHYTTPFNKTLEMLFRDDDLAKLRQVKGMVDTHDMENYQLLPHASFHMNFDGAPVPTIKPDRLFLQAGRIGPLIEVAREIERIYLQYEEVKNVLKWLNRNATPGAIRYYWPAAMKLTKGSPIWADLQEVPSRYSNPPKLGDWLQSIKDASNTVTSMLLLPNDVSARTRGKMWLTFSSRKVPVGGDSFYATDQIIFNL